MEQRQEKKRFGWRARLLVLSGAALLALATGELGLRIVGWFEPEPDAYVGDHPDAPSLTFVHDPETGWRMRPSHSFRWSTEGRSIEYCSDADGYRISSKSEPSLATRRIVFIGDSFTWGTGVMYEETFAAQVCSAIEGTEARILAMPGYGVDQAWRSLEVAGFRMQPDLVIFGLYPEDFGRSLQAYRWKERFNKPAFRRTDEGLVRRRPEDRPGAIFRFLDERSYLFSLFKASWRTLGRTLPVGEWWHLNAAILDATIESCREHDVPVLFVHIPEKRWRSFSTLSGFFAERDTSYLDLWRVSESPPEGAYFQTDSHLSPDGHRFVAQQIRAWIEHNRVLE